MGINVHLKKSIIIRGGLLLNVLALSACGGTPTSNQIAPAQATAPVITSAGTDFYLTLPNHLCASNPAACLTAPATNKLIVAASSSTTGEMTFNGVVTPFSVAAGKPVATLRGRRRCERGHCNLSDGQLLVHAWVESG